MNHIKNILWSHGIKLEIYNTKIKRKNTNICKLNNIPLNNQWVKEEITREIWKYSALKNNENSTEQTQQPEFSP